MNCVCQDFSQGILYSAGDYVHQEQRSICGEGQHICPSLHSNCTTVDESGRGQKAANHICGLLHRVLIGEKEAALSDEHLIFVDIWRAKMRNMKPKIYKLKSYPHFDAKIHWKQVKEQVENPQYIVHHAFYPFIHYTQEMKKYPKQYMSNNRLGGRDEPKKRSIMYSSHIDRYIYEYYAYLLNECYEQYLKKYGMGKCAIAYRSSLHKNNIHFAKEAFYRIRSMENCLVIIGDFTKYFDKIDHNYLKKCLCEVYGEDKLSQDQYVVFRSITKHSWMQLDEIRERKNLKRKDFNKLERLFTPEEFRAFKKEHLRKNQNDYGIPQGSAISAVYSNVYLIEFDRQMHAFCRKNQGFYRRYCDDFIVVLPYDLRLNQQHINKVYEIKDSIKNLTLQQEKTQVLHYQQGIITSENELYLQNVSNGKPQISYLGFTFDGAQIRIRSKTIAKYYERMYSKADNIAALDERYPEGKHVSRRNIYRLYSYKGMKVSSDKKKHGNFLSYVDRASKIFKSEPITQDTKHSWGKLQRRLRPSQKK